MELKEYQREKIERLKGEINELLNLPDNRTVIFKSPTGSGKTLMVAETLKRLVKNRDDSRQLSFIWIAPRMLHGQSKDKLDEYYENDRTLECSDIDDLQDGLIQENEILFLNWESLNKKNNVLMIDNEQEKNLTRIVEKTKEEGREIILIIDESHHTAKTETARRLINDISPKITLEVSATPHLVVMDGNNSPRIVEVDFTEVIKEGMIKKEININPEIDKAKVNKSSADTLVIQCALNKRKELIEKLKKEKSNVNPLILIQLPDKKAGVSVDKKDEIIKILEKEKITEANGKLAIWLSEEKTPNLANIEKPDDEAEVLIFKQAIALGWDCPRAAIMILFRDHRSYEFSIQTLGRIMRMPEFHHYPEEILNKGYVFTNLSDISIAEDISKDYITIYESKRIKDYSNIDLQSIHIERQREKTRLSGQFSEIFLEVGTKNKLHNSIDLKSKAVTEIMVDGRIQKIDQILEHVHKEGILKVKQTDAEMQYIFEMYIRENCKPYAPADSSGRIRTAIYKFFEKKLRIKDEEEIQKIILSDNNMKKVAENISEAKEQYKKVVVEQLEEANIEKYRWNAPEIINYNSNYKEIKVKKAVMTPLYAKIQSKVEQDFIKDLEDSKEVEWWFKNGDGEKKYFAVEWVDEFGKKHGFYVDFIIKLKNGKICLFDTKSGRTAQGDAKQKAEALAQYINNENKRGKKLVGGLVLPKDNHWRYNDSLNYSYNDKDISNWKYLKFNEL